MKFDSEAKYCHSPQDHEPTSKSVKFNDNPIVTDIPGTDNEVQREEKLDPDFLESQTYKVDTGLLPSGKSAGDGVQQRRESNEYTFMNDSIIGRINGGEDMVVPCSVPIAEVELSEKEAGLYTDKTVREIGLSELIVCFKEGSYHVVKDICVDEGIHSQDKILVEIDRLDHKTVTGFPHYDWDEENDLNKKEDGDGTVGLKSCTLNEKLISSESKEVPKKLSPGSLQKEGGDNYDTKTDTVNEVDNGISALDGLITLRRLISSEDMDSEQSSPWSLCEKDGGEIDSMNETLNGFSGGKAMSGKPVLVQKLDAKNINNHHQANQAASEESTSTLSSAAEESNHDMVLHFNSKMESESITFNFDSHAPATSRRDDHKENTHSQQSAQSLVELGHQVGVLEGASSRSLLAQHDHGDMSFRGTGVFSGPIVYSGSIPYSGSISLRSDSSTASTRSFAFPILHAEWNSSPVKMAKADRRLYKKHRGWLGNLFCCKF